MKRSRREAAKRTLENRQQDRSARRLVAIENEAQKARAIREALERANAERKRTSVHFSFSGVDRVFGAAPRLTEEPYKQAVTRLFQMDHCRSIDTWKPKGKGRDTLFRSLAEHLLAKYPTPSVVWSGLFENAFSQFMPLIRVVASGGSLFQWVNSKTEDFLFPVPLTRKMCHDVLTSKEPTLLRAIRKAEINAFGGDRRLFDAWMSTRYGQHLHSRTEETFWQTVLAFLAKNPMLEPSQVGPLVDYIAHRRNEDPNFTLKGRSVLALLQGQQDWHKGLARARVQRYVEFKPSGFKPGTFNRSRRDAQGDHVKEVWRVREILNNKELAAEGRRMSHCVYSYEPAIVRGVTSIWVMTMEDGRGETGNWAMLTIEVRNAMKSIVQARGRFNKMPDNAASRVLLEWANLNGFTVSLGKW